MASDNPAEHNESPKFVKVTLGSISISGPSPEIFNPAAGQLPSPEAMAAYAAIDPSYPKFLQETFSEELKRNYQYQLVALVAGWSFGALLVCGSIFLVYTGHPEMAASLMGVNFLGLATRMLTKSATRRS